MKSAKRVIAILLSICMTISFAGCSQNTTVVEPAQSEASTGNTNEKTAKEEHVKLTIMDFSDAVKPQRDAANAAWTEKTGVEIEYTLTTANQLSSTILTAVKSGQCPDIFALPSGVTAQQAVDEGWFICLEDYVDPSEWERFREDSFANGKCIVNGKKYFLPENPYGPSSCVFYNKQIFREAGLDPENPPKTYSEFIDAAKKITEAGQGRYYGVVEAGAQENRMDALAVDWATLIGAAHRRSGYPLNIRTGTVDWNEEAVYKVFELWKTLYEDGSIHPNSASYANPDARAAFAQGQAGMCVNGWWNVGSWAVSNPELEFGIFAPPVPDGEEYTGCIPCTAATAYLGVYAGSEHIEEAVDYLMHCYAGEEYQSSAVAAGTHISFLKGVNEKYNVMPAAAQFYQINTDLGRQVPQPEIINSETSKALAYYTDVKPNAYNILAGVISGQITDYKTALAEYSAAATEAWMAAIEKANQDGCNLSVDDFAFPDWDPKKDYENVPVK